MGTDRQGLKTDQRINLYHIEWEQAIAGVLGVTTNCSGSICGRKVLPSGSTAGLPWEIGRIF